MNRLLAVLTVMTLALAAGGASISASAAAPPRAPVHQTQGADCRTYSGTEVCGGLKLTDQQRACVQQSVAKGMTDRRAEVECHTYS
ncbi:hypothetical protein [Actinomadura macrotermitis]|uniref:DUF3551 domain-containing protein n=1 Tax=Actinomadura macrotermitis TaxID=2585200 RepID=A0A7K0C2H1_9ACTN|nr:hypothetical protein [Actinomadura macrotermitis]MQY07625.1 hypothetical protein [Actinomadura macrotermitis]